MKEYVLFLLIAAAALAVSYAVWAFLVVLRDEKNYKKELTTPKPRLMVSGDIMGGKGGYRVEVIHQRTNFSDEWVVSRYIVKRVMIEEDLYG